LPEKGRYTLVPYYWIEFDAYKSDKRKKDYVEKVIIDYKQEFEINFG